MGRLVVGVFLAMFLLVSLGVAHAQSSGLAASTSQSSYSPGDRIVISGSVQQVTDNNPVTIIVRNPIGNVYEVGQIPLVNNGFTHAFVLSNDAQSGTYTANLRQDGKTAQIQFQVVAGQVQVIPVFDAQIRAGSKDSSLKYGTATVSTADNSINIPVDTSKMQNGTIQVEYHIPKRVIDSTYGQLVIKQNGVVSDCAQTDAGTERVVDCTVNKGTYAISIVGTSVIPEFGPVVMITLAAATVGAIVLSRKMSPPRTI
ncbi:MAG TPA: hypothetical protein VJ792_07480 [Candidatus Nitrosotalea sp.]|nr:hypothetical protein [Candidatus Nitrosotalea sp.]